MDNFSDQYKWGWGGADISELVEQTISKIDGLPNTWYDDDDGEGLTDEIVFTLADGRRLLMWHQQDCCEGVGIVDIVGDRRVIIGYPIRRAECLTNQFGSGCDSCTWSFYTIATDIGSLTIAWKGESNGYYSESVDLAWIPEGVNA